MDKDIDKKIDDFRNRKYSSHNDTILYSKEDIINYFQNKICVYFTDEKLMKNFSPTYIEKWREYISRFVEKTKKIVLPPSEGLWAYEMYANDTGISLYYCYYGKCIYNEHGDFYWGYTWTQRMLICKEASGLLTPEEYAEIYNVQSKTVRQWIRRGKFKNCVKDGDGWKIPELTDLPDRKKNDRCIYYEWDQDLTFPDKYKYLSKGDRVAIHPKKRGEKRLIVIEKSLQFISDDEEWTKMYLTDEETRELEVFLIANPEVEYREGVNNVEINGGMT